MSKNSCDYYPNCEICPNNDDCIFKNDYEDNSILPLIKFELEYRIRHNRHTLEFRKKNNNSEYSRSITTLKSLDLEEILNWYNQRYGCEVSLSDLEDYIRNSNLKGVMGLPQ